eukprot:g2731.t1
MPHVDVAPRPPLLLVLLSLLPVVVDGASTLSLHTALRLVDEAEGQLERGQATSETVRTLRRVAASVNIDATADSVDFNRTLPAARSLFSLGEIYRAGTRGVRQDPQAAIKCYKQAAQLGNATAQYALATIYDDGLFGVGQSKGKSVLYDYFAALGGEQPALMSMGFRHEQGKGTPISCEASTAYYEQAAEEVLKTWHTSPTVEHHPFFLFRGPDPYHQYLTIDESVMHAYVMQSDQAFSSGEGAEARVSSLSSEGYLSRAAAHGPAKLASALGKLYYWGTGYLQPDLHRAAQLMERAAALGNEAEVVVELGRLYLEGTSGGSGGGEGKRRGEGAGDIEREDGDGESIHESMGQ